MNKMFLMVPFTGLGLYNGFRGNRWLRNRIKIFKQFVIPSLLNQTDRDFVLWVAWRPHERMNPYVNELYDYLAKIENFKFIFTYSGVPMYDDKYEDEEARVRVADAINGSLRSLINLAPEADEILWMMQPSDDLYDKLTVASVKLGFAANPQVNALSFTKGFICNYFTKEIKEYNPKTNPPFAAIRFPRGVFFDPAKHLAHISLKKDSGQYKTGTPLPSHEYLADCLVTGFFDGRGFMVGTHEDNISTVYDHPYAGSTQDKDAILDRFGIADVEPLKHSFSLRRKFFHALPYKVKRKLRYFAERDWAFRPLFSLVYNLLRS